MGKRACIIFSLFYLSCSWVSLVRGELDEANLRGHEISQVPSTARYELVQSHLAAKYTFKVDKFTGNVYQLVKDKNDDLQWQLIDRLNHPKDSQKENQINYQLFTSGLACQFTYLLNIFTGATWQLTQDSKTEELFWQPMIPHPNPTNASTATGESDDGYSAKSDPNSIFYQK